jgi:RNA 2',3'-cyclic 3'-phosphodiesterase
MQPQRLFIAIELSANIIRALEQTIHSYQQSRLDAVHWVMAKNIHLTLRFLGDTNADQLELIKTSLPAALSQQDAFELMVEGSGAFPNIRAPRVIWVGVTAPANLARVQQIVEKGCCQAGFETEKRPFSPHLTLGRVEPFGAAQVGAALNSNRVGQLGRSLVNHVTLFKSDLTRGGAIYTPLVQFPLKTL